MFFSTSKHAATIFKSYTYFSREKSTAINQKKIGILGGLGPYATLKLVEHILSISKTLGAQEDADYPNMNILMNCDTPDRSSSLLFGTESPFQSLKNGLLTLENSGCDFAVIPCNTAHSWLPELENSVSIPIINMISSTAKHIDEVYPNKNWLLLSTTGTVKTEIFTKNFQGYDIKLKQFNLESEEQSKIQHAIYGSYGIKAGYDLTCHDALTKSGIESPTKIIDEIIRSNIAKGTEGIILGCTELPLAVNASFYNIPILDPMHIIAERCVKECLNNSNLNLNLIKKNGSPGSCVGAKL